MQFIKWSNPDANFYSALYDILKREAGLINSSGVNYIREQISFKNKTDFRVETALAMLDRYGVTEGDAEKRNLVIINELPDILQDEDHLKEKTFK